MERTILHSDMNNFYASCECREHPELQNKPVAVCGSVEERHGIVLAKNYLAKSCGVRTGETVWQAKQKCRGLVIVEPHYELYLKYSSLAKDIYSDYTDEIEPYGMDECWLDVTGSLMVMGSGEKIANEIRERIKKELGLTVSIGVSFNKIFAKLGSDLKKPDAVTCITSDKYKEMLWDLPASNMLGVGRATKKRLDRYGIMTIGQLAETDEKNLRALFGTFGTHLWKYANGMDNSPVLKADMTVPAKSVGRGTTTVRDLETGEEVWQVMLKLCQEIGEKLRDYRQRALGVSVVVRNNELFIKQWQCKLPAPTQNALLIAKEAYRLFSRSYSWEKPIRSLTVTAINLANENIPYQTDMFFDFSKAERTERLDSCVSRLRHRYGSGIIMPARLFNNKLTGFGETRIIMPSGMV